jgi:hypothetical protein
MEYKNPKLYIDTDQNIDSKYKNNDMVKSTIFTDNNRFQNVLQKSRWLIENMIQYKKREDIKTQVLSILLFIAFNLPYIGLDIYFWEYADNFEQYLYITISIKQRIVSVFISSYYMLVSDIDDVYKQIKNKNGFYYLCNIDMNWCRYYSSIGILLSIKYYFLHGHLDMIYLYISIISILKLCTMFYFITQI